MCKQTATAVVRKLRHFTHILIDALSSTIGKVMSVDSVTNMSVLYAGTSPVNVEYQVVFATCYAQSKSTLWQSYNEHTEWLITHQASI